jgi:hypothetical protein
MSDAIWNANCKKYPQLAEAATKSGLPEAAYDILIRARRRETQPSQADRVRFALNTQADPPEGLARIEGKVISVKPVRFGNGGSAVNALVQCEGYRVFGPAPKCPQVRIGDVVRLTADFRRAPEATGFGFYRSPRDVEIVP